MAGSKASTVKAYLEELPPERRNVIASLRKLIRKNIPKGYEEAMNYGAICYQVPLKKYPDTYNGQPLCYAALAAQKNHYSLYLMCVYGSVEKAGRLKQAFQKAGKKLDMGKSCVRFRSPDDLALDAIADVIASATPDQYIAKYEAALKKAKKLRSS